MFWNVFNILKNLFILLSIVNLASANKGLGQSRVKCLPDKK